MLPPSDKPGFHDPMEELLGPTFDQRMWDATPPAEPVEAVEKPPVPETSPEIPQETSADEERRIAA
jgi:hypothetical protein